MPCSYWTFRALHVVPQESKGLGGALPLMLAWSLMKIQNGPESHLRIQAPRNIDGEESCCSIMVVKLYGEILGTVDQLYVQVINSVNRLFGALEKNLSRSTYPIIQVLWSQTHAQSQAQSCYFSLSAKCPDSQAFRRSSGGHRARQNNPICRVTDTSFENDAMCPDSQELCSLSHLHGKCTSWLKQATQWQQRCAQSARLFDLDEKE